MFSIWSVMQRFYASLDFPQMPVMVDVLRNEKPVRLGWYEEDPRMFHLLTVRSRLAKARRRTESAAALRTNTQCMIP